MQLHSYQYTYLYHYHYTIIDLGVRKSAWIDWTVDTGKVNCERVKSYSLIVVKLVFNVLTGWHVLMYVWLI